jgi:hypothetical protein
MMPRAPRTAILWVLGLACTALLSPSCDTAERAAVASETETVLVSRETCEIGSFSSVSQCSPAAACHVCARLDGDDGVCVQPCTIGGNDCPGGQTCRPIGELRDAGGYARIGDCPLGYCR